MGSSLTTGEKKQLKDHEATIERGLNSFVEVGRALTAIRDGGLYTDVDDTFDGYCKKRWNIGRHRAYQLIESAGVVDNLSTLKDVPAPENEAQARVLASIEGERKQADVWSKAVETAPKGNDGKPKVTAAHVRKVADEVSAPKPKPVEKPATEPEPAKLLDANGRDLPPAIRPAFEQAEEFNAALQACRDLAAMVKALGELSPFLHVQSCAADLNNAKQAIKFAKPYAVCPYCKGKKCQACKQTGWVPKNIYEQAPEDKK
jgi:hypothetical protein